MMSLGENTISRKVPGSHGGSTIYDEIFCLWQYNYI